VNFNITRRQFLQYCTASAAALGLSQTDLLKLEKALATPQPATSQPSPSVIWLSAQACSGCPVALLNRVNSYAGNPYYDADMLNALYGTALTPPGALGNDPAGLPLQVVNDAADLLVGDAVRALTGISRGNLWSDDMSGVLPGTLLDAYAAAFPTGYITLDWNATVMASGGDVAAAHLRTIREGGGILGVFVLVVDGAIPAKDKNYCYVFDNDDGAAGRVIKIGDTINSTAGSLNIPYQAPVSANEALEWLAGAPGCLAVVSVGTCASYGGIPGGAGNRTGATGVANYLGSVGVSTPVINVPGCPPHPDWIVYPVAHVLATTTMSPFVLGVPTLDQWGRPQAVYSGSGNHPDPYTPFCMDCPNKDTQGTTGAAQELGDAGCLGAKGCKGPYTVGDCPIRGKNTTDDGFSMNWCVGASGQNNAGGPAVSHLGEARHPCQGCIQPDFPDWKGLTSDGDTTNKRVKGFYNE
jgi:hydrogenase small subunit